MNDGTHTRIIDGFSYTWKVQELWQLSKGLPVFEVTPESIINLDVDGWFRNKVPTTRLVLAHMARIKNADLNYPVILNFDGTIMDGAHRVCKAILEGIKAIKVVQFIRLPETTTLPQKL